MAKFTNQAVLTYNGLTTNSNIVTGEIMQAITAKKDVSYNKYRHGDILTYVVNLQNSGTADITGLTITDDLGSYPFGEGSVVPLTHTGDPVLYYVNGIAQATPAVTAGPPLVISGIGVPAGKSASVVYRAAVNEFAPTGAGGKIDNTATISGGGLSSDVTALKTVTSEQTAALTIFKALSPAAIVEKGGLTYTLTIRNTGASAVGGEGSDLVISDTFTPALEAPLAVTLDGTPLAITENYTYDAESGEFATVAGRITVPAATYEQDATTGAWTVTPGVTVLTITGTVK